MNEHLRDRILRKLETLSDERGYQVLDYVEFLESRYAERTSPNASVFTRFTEAIEDKLEPQRSIFGPNPGRYSTCDVQSPYQSRT